GAGDPPQPLTRGLFPLPRHADGIFNKAYRKLLGQLSARKYLLSACSFPRWALVLLERRRWKGRGWGEQSCSGQGRECAEPAMSLVESGSPGISVSLVFSAGVRGDLFGLLC
uniref:Glucagon / GIP / secretin / VIP family domain-containing protein n=1 Tax=Cyanistes caeruleus TaxID=156563 RepID=A0A8C0TY02_CYACU